MSRSVDQYLKVPTLRRRKESSKGLAEDLRNASGRKAIYQVFPDAASEII